jgi:hypothetical protein
MWFARDKIIMTVIFKKMWLIIFPYIFFFFGNSDPDYDIVLQGKNTYVKTPESDSGKDSNGDVESMKPQRPFSLQVWFCWILSA